MEERTVRIDGATVLGGIIVSQTSAPVLAAPADDGFVRITREALAAVCKRFGIPASVFAEGHTSFSAALVAGEPFARHIEPEDMVAAARAAWEEVSADVKPDYVV